MTAPTILGFDAAELADTVTRIRRAQGLPDRITDPSVVASVAARFNMAGRRADLLDAKGKGVGRVDGTAGPDRLKPGQSTPVGEVGAVVTPSASTSPMSTADHCGEVGVLLGSPTSPESSGSDSRTPGAGTAIPLSRRAS